MNKFLLIALITFPLACFAGTERLNYQGKLAQGNTPVTGMVPMIFQIYDGQSGTNVLYEESMSVDVVDGYYSVEIGENPGSGDLVDAIKREDSHLQVTVGGKKLKPRERVGKPPFAVHTTEVWREGDLAVSNAFVAADAVIQGQVDGIVSEGAPNYAAVSTAALSAVQPDDAAQLDSLRLGDGSGSLVGGYEYDGTNFVGISAPLLIMPGGSTWPDYYSDYAVLTKGEADDLYGTVTNTVTNTVAQVVQGSITNSPVGNIITLDTGTNTDSLVKYELLETYADDLTNFVTKGSTVFNVKDYGATADGSTSDVDEIDAALQACYAAGGGVVYFPAGTYAIGNESAQPSYTSGETGLQANICITNNNVHLIGAGMGATILKRVGGSDSRNLFNSSYTTNCSIRDMTIDMGAKLCYDGASFEFLLNWQIINTEWKNHAPGNSGADGLEFRECADIHIRGCCFENIAANALALDGGATTTIGFVSDCYFYNCGYNDPALYTIDTHYAGNWAAFQMRGCTVNANNITMEECPTAIQTLGRLNLSNARISGTSSANTLIYLGSGFVNMNNVFAGNVGDGGTAIHSAPLDLMGGGGTEGSGSKLKINNMVMDLTTTATGIYSAHKLNLQNSQISSSLGHAVRLAGTGNSLIGNSLTSSTGTGLRVVDTLTDSVISENTISTVTFEGGASSSSGNILSQNSIYSVYTGGTDTKYTDNIIKDRFQVNAGTSPSVADGNWFYDLEFNSIQTWIIRDNIFDYDDMGIDVSEAQKNSATWINNRQFDGSPINGTAVITTNYTANAIDEVMIFNGSSLTSFLPDASLAGLKNHPGITIKNINSTDLVIDGDGTDTLDGSATVSLAQWESVTVRSDGSNWVIIGN